VGPGNLGKEWIYSSVFNGFSVPRIDLFAPRGLQGLKPGAYTANWYIVSKYSFIVPARRVFWNADDSGRLHQTLHGRGGKDEVSGPPGFISVT